MIELLFNIQKKGANARALGKALGDNPYYKSEKMPAVTGEGVDEWHKKAVAWELGWKMEDLMR